jgi:hypothetical protein
MGYYTKNGGLIGTGNLIERQGVHDIIASQLLGIGLYAFSSFTFTNGTATGDNGPSLANLLASYNTSTYPWLNDTQYFNVTGGIQEWTVPASGTYRIEARGARGGNGNTGPGGAGARIITDIDLSINDKLRILVGQNGGDRGSGTNLTGAGGGGTFVTKYVATLSLTQQSDIIVIAGGGGGSGSSFGGGPGRTSNAGQDGLGGSSGIGGINGGGGGAAWNGVAGNGTIPGGTGTNCSYGAGGGGFFSNGGQNCSGASPFVEGIAFIAGGAGGPADTLRSGVPGGFGGGAGVGHRAPGGGGYSGGGGDGTGTGGGGGGSYWSGTLVSSDCGYNSDNGLVTITRL